MQFGKKIQAELDKNSKLVTKTLIPLFVPKSLFEAEEKMQKVLPKNVQL